MKTRERTQTVANDGCASINPKAETPAAACFLSPTPTYRSPHFEPMVGAASSLLLDSHECLVASTDPSHLVALVGCEGLVVVHTPTATLVMPAAHAQRVKDLHALVAAQFPELA